MEKPFFDYEDGDFAHTFSDNRAIDSDGYMLMRMGDNIAMDMETGDEKWHQISSEFYFMAPFWHHFQLSRCCKVSKRASRFLGKPHKI